MPFSAAPCSRAFAFTLIATAVKIFGFWAFGGSGKNQKSRILYIIFFLLFYTLVLLPKIFWAFGLSGRKKHIICCFPAFSYSPKPVQNKSKHSPKVQTLHTRPFVLFMERCSFRLDVYATLSTHLTIGTMDLKNKMSVYFSGDQLERIANFCEVVGISIPESPTLANIFLQVLDQHEYRCNAFASTVSELENLNADLQRQIESSNSVEASQDSFLQEQLDEANAKYARLANVHTELRDRAKGSKELHTKYEALLAENKQLKAEIVSFSRMVQQEQQEKEQTPIKKGNWFHNMYNKK